MPRINLLPVRAQRRVGNARNELIIFAALMLFSCAGLYFWYNTMQTAVHDLENAIADTRDEIAKLEKKVVQVEEFKKKSQILETKLAVIDTLKRQKVGPTKLLGDLADILTKLRKVWLLSIREDNGKFVLQGGAMEHENISEFQMALQQQSKFFTNVTLALVSTAKDGMFDYLSWTITCIANYGAG